MKAEEIKLAFNTNIQLNIVGILQGDLGKGDSAIVNGRKGIQTAVEGYGQAISVYSSIIPTANKYLDMAKALGEASIQKQLETVIKDANEMIKASNTAINKLKSV